MESEIIRKSPWSFKRVDKSSNIRDNNSIKVFVTKKRPNTSKTEYSRPNFHIKPLNVDSPIRKDFTNLLSSSKSVISKNYRKNALLDSNKCIHNELDGYFKNISIDTMSVQSVKNSMYTTTMYSKFTIKNCNKNAFKLSLNNNQAFKYKLSKTYKPRSNTPIPSKKKQYNHKNLNDRKFVKTNYMIKVPNMFLKFDFNKLTSKLL